MKGTPLNTLPKESVDAIVRSTERIEGAASILAMLEEKADGGRVTPSGACSRAARRSWMEPGRERENENLSLWPKRRFSGLRRISARQPRGCSAEPFRII